MTNSHSNILQQQQIVQQILPKKLDFTVTETANVSLVALNQQLRGPQGGIKGMVWGWGGGETFVVLIIYMLVNGYCP